MKRLAYAGLLLISSAVAYGRPEIYNAENAGIVFDYSQPGQGTLCVGLEVKGEPGFFGPTNDC